MPPAVVVPPRFPAPPRPKEDLEIAVRRRMLWVGSAAFPLRNITRVEASRAKPYRDTPFVGFLKWLAFAVLAYLVLGVVDGGRAWRGTEGDAFLLAAVIGLVLLVLGGLFRPPRPVLVVETAAGSVTVVTLPNMDQLRVIAGQIVHAIDHPDADFAAYVRRLDNANGNVVHQRGGNNGRNGW
ncbi:DUF6232 family protein [Streptomyces sp. NPDC047974]|uniref:DUF6232 family protein n=1 Tax=Streptomyces sp. NPDC047974 TaxID=3154343 RepID=UPI0033CF8063